MSGPKSEQSLSGNDVSELLVTMVRRLDSLDAKLALVDWQTRVLVDLLTRMDPHGVLQSMRKPTHSSTATEKT